MMGIRWRFWVESAVDAENAEVPGRLWDAENAENLRRAKVSSKNSRFDFNFHGDVVEARGALFRVFRVK
jgi:hypothetical protein